MATRTSVSHVYPLGSFLDERGRLRLGGCDAIELAERFGTPAYVFVEEDLRERARAFLAAGAATGHPDFHVAFASKACPCTAVLRVFAEEGLWCDVASGGELQLALLAGFEPGRIIMHGNAKSLEELELALGVGVGLIVIDNFDEVDRLERLTAERAGRHEPPQAVLVRVTPDVAGETHAKISTGQAASKFGFAMGEVRAAGERIAAAGGLSLEGVHAHIGSQLLDLEPFGRELAALASLGPQRIWDVGGGLGAAYTEAQEAPSIKSYVEAIVAAARPAHDDRRLILEPGRALVANAGVTLYTVQSVKRNRSTWVAVDGGMSDNLRPMLYGSPYEAQVADRFGGGVDCVLAGKHCESGDVIVQEADLDDPREGDVVVTPVTGAYGYAMANNYNGVLRAPVIFCRDGEARLVVRRERFEDLTSRDVD
jgi:diaminopimelate decarboxylase